MTPQPPDSSVAVPSAAVALSTASVYPEPTGVAFALARELAYDAVEVMVSIDPESQDLDGVRRLRDRYQVPVVAVHAPCLLITQRVWGVDPWGKLERSAEMAHALEADTVVVHPAFRWQRDYARDFLTGIEELEERTGLAYAVENMYPWRAARREVVPYTPAWDPRDHDARHVTLDVSHCATAEDDALTLARDLGDRLHHVHMTDGGGSAKDEHLVPGHGTQPCAELLEHLAGKGFGGHVVVEISTRRADGRDARVDALAESLAFTRLHLAAAAGGDPAGEGPRVVQSPRGGGA